MYYRLITSSVREFDSLMTCTHSFHLQAIRSAQQLVRLDAIPLVRPTLVAGTTGHQQRQTLPSRVSPTLLSVVLIK